MYLQLSNYSLKTSCAFLWKYLFQTMTFDYRSVMNSKQIDITLLYEQKQKVIIFMILFWIAKISAEIRCLFREECKLVSLSLTNFLWWNENTVSCVIVATTVHRSFITVFAMTFWPLIPWFYSSAITITTFGVMRLWKEPVDRIHTKSNLQLQLKNKELHFPNVMLFGFY